MIATRELKWFTGQSVSDFLILTIWLVCPQGEYEMLLHVPIITNFWESICVSMCWKVFKRAEKSCRKILSHAYKYNSSIIRINLTIRYRFKANAHRHDFTVHTLRFERALSPFAQYYGNQLNNLSIQSGHSLRWTYLKTSNIIFWMFQRFETVSL